MARSGPVAGAGAPNRRLVAGVLLTIVGITVAILAASGGVDGDPDFPNYYFAGQALLDGMNPYEPIVEDVAAAFPEADPYDAYPADPPLTVALLSPLSLLDYEVAWWLFALAGIGVVWWVVYRTARILAWSPGLAAAAGGVALLSTSVRFMAVRNHMEWIVLLAIFLGWAGLRRDQEGAIGGRSGERSGGWGGGRSRRWGAAWGAAGALKLFPGLLTLGLAFSRRWRAFWWSVGTATGLLLLGVAAVGIDTTLEFVREVVPQSRQWYGTLGNYSLLSFGTALVGEWLGWLLTGLAVPLVLWALWRAAPSIDRIYVVGIAGSLLLSPLAWHNYMILTFPALLLVIQSLDLDEMSHRFTALALVGGIAFWGPVTFSTQTATVLVSFVPMYGLVGLIAASRRLASESMNPTAPNPVGSADL